jgi:hypothetical protein
MLKRWLVVGLLMLGAAPFVSAAYTRAERATVACPDGEIWSTVQRMCVISVGVPGVPNQPATTAPDRGVPPGTGMRTSVDRKCISKTTGEDLPCRQGRSWWSNGWNCYVEVADPQPPKSDSSWLGHTAGTIYACYDPGLVGTRMTYRWSAVSPAGPAAPPDPRVLARRAVALMGLRAIRIGIVPEDRPGAVGIIGLPTWMWVEGPGQSSWGPISRTASAGGYSVTATGSVERVVWRMGDGSTVVCRTPGTAYADSFGKRSSPDCGHTYTRQGTYTVRATSYWVVRWSGMGQSGSIPLSFTQTTVITMGEVQVLTQ